MGPDGAGGWLESSCKLIISVRIGILLVTLLSLPDQDERTPAIVAILAVGVASYVPLRFWGRVGPGLVRHPAYFAAELVVTTVILLLTGVDSPFLYYAQATALLGGLIYGRPGAALFGTLLVGVYFWVLDRADGAAARLVPGARRRAGAVPGRRGRRRGDAPPARPPGRGRGGAVGAGAPARGGGGAGAARARHA